MNWPDLDLPPINLWNLPDYFGIENKMKIQIFGYGFVGRAHALALESSYVRTYVYDPALGYDELIENPDAAIICVSTPQAPDGSCFMGNVKDAISACPDIPILIKSTISLEGWRNLLKEFPDKQLTFSPEYLRANHAMEDFKNQKEIYIGGGDIPFWATQLCMSLNVKVTGKDPEALILAKYFRNSFLATKVAFFNQIDDMCVDAGVDPDTVCDLVAEDPRIGTSHSYVYQDPHQRGFGGHCFPKDTAALLETAEFYGNDLTILREAVEYNKRLRGK